MWKTKDDIWFTFGQSYKQGAMRNRASASARRAMSLVIAYEDLFDKEVVDEGNIFI